MQYAQLTKAIQDHYNPAPNKHAERYRFSQRTMKEGETIAEFIADLRKLSINCKYENLEDMLKDKLLASIKHKPTLDRLLAEDEDKLTYTKAMEIALSMETSNKEVQNMLDPSSTSSLHKLSSRPVNHPNPLHRH